ncbi:hypothetical protein ANCCAN_09314, partial [Ancylostoma caninum]
GRHGGAINSYSTCWSHNVGLFWWCSSPERNNFQEIFFVVENFSYLTFFALETIRMFHGRCCSGCSWSSQLTGCRKLVVEREAIASIGRAH